MLKNILVIAATILTASGMAQHTVIVKIDSLPRYHSYGNDIYITGSFNGWNPQDINYRFQKDKEGKYFIKLLLDDGDYEYKLTRGGWDKVECKMDGSGIDNHPVNVEADTTISINVDEWLDRFPKAPKVSTASKNVYSLDASFGLPQLKRTRNVWIYLPENYKKTKKRFPVLYMQDGQNVFDEATAFAGEWGVDEYFDSVNDKGLQAIVVAVENGGAKRMNEYCPYDTKKFGKGEGNAYADFLVKTLKPFIDKHYRTLKNKANTSIAGSSMGGLISFYTVLKYPKVFGGAGIFSPSLWVAPKMFDEIKAKAAKVNSKIYFYAGKQEDEKMVQDVLKAFELMGKFSKSKITAVIRDDGKHNEPTWRKEFPLFYEWMMK